MFGLDVTTFLAAESWEIKSPLGVGIDVFAVWSLLLFILLLLLLLTTYYL